MKAYVAFFDGDIDHLAPLSGQTCDQVLVRIRDEYGFGKENQQREYFGEIETPDPEDDKIEVWELDTDSGSCLIVWGFWGWHWTVPEGLEQGTIPGCSKPLYNLAMEE